MIPNFNYTQIFITSKKKSFLKEINIANYYAIVI